jgi:hypothetical protein
MVGNEERVKTMPYSILFAGWLLASHGPLGEVGLNGKWNMADGTRAGFCHLPFAICHSGCVFQHPAQASVHADPAAAPAAHQGAKRPAERPAAVEVATHATKGVVKTVSATALVITRRTAGKRTDTSFVLTLSTQKEGVLAAGSTVEIRYRTEGNQRIATAVSVEDAPQ